MHIKPEHRIGLDEVYQMLSEPSALTLSEQAKEKIEHCRQWLDNELKESDRAIYGINTGFGSLCDVRIDKESLSQLQENLIRSHAVGMGEAMPSEISRLMLWFKLHSLSQGFSGIRLETAEAILSIHNSGLFPVVYEFGSLGASGDLAPLAHLFLPLVGDGQVWTENEGASMDSFPWSSVLPKDFKLGAKEGLALLNGTQFMSACGAYILIRAYRISYLADLISSITLDAMNARAEPFDERLHLIRNQKGQALVAARIREFLDDSPTFHNNDKPQVQDPYSLRCIPQVHGANHQVLAYVRDLVENEINSVTDNPTIFPGEAILSGGNFHGQAIAMALDHLAVAISEWGSISERRVFQLISGKQGLPAFLTPNPGLNSGLMIPQYTAASIASRNKALCVPASADSIPSSNNQEDHVSMGANAATRLFDLVENVERILAIELFTASQALHLSGRKTSAFLESFLENYRSHVPLVEDDRIFHYDLENTLDFLSETEIDSDLLFI
jgi:histidine ammonia-lyase